MDPADGQQHVAGVQRTGGAGRAGGGTDPPVVQQEQEGLPLDAFKAEVDIAGEALYRIPVQQGVGDPGQPPDQLVPQGGQPPRVLIEAGAGQLQSGGHPHDGGEIFRTGSPASLLRAAFDQGE